MPSSIAEPFLHVLESRGWRGGLSTGEYRHTFLPDSSAGEGEERRKGVVQRKAPTDLVFLFIQIWSLFILALRCTFTDTFWEVPKDLHTSEHRDCRSTGTATGEGEHINTSREPVQTEEVLWTVKSTTSVLLHSARLDKLKANIASSRLLASPEGYHALPQPLGCPRQEWPLCVLE